MELRELLVEAIERAEAVGSEAPHAHVLTLVDQSTPRDAPKWVSWTLAEAKEHLALLDAKVMH